MSRHTNKRMPGNPLTNFSFEQVKQARFATRTASSDDMHTAESNKEVPARTTSRARVKPKQRANKPVASCGFTIFEDPEISQKPAAKTAQTRIITKGQKAIIQRKKRGTKPLFVLQNNKDGASISLSTALKM